MEEVVGFTQNQRNWFLSRSAISNKGVPRCEAYHFNIFKMKWERCSATRNLQVHHIVPRGWARKHMPKSFMLNGSMNGIVLCGDSCHCGKNGVHPDTYEALQKYRKGNKNAFKEMMDERRIKNNKGIPYWNTRWDMQFARICRKATLKFIRANPYPANGNRGNTGRL